jgi:RNA polymerase sigma-70 factor (sigma-E family)
VAGEERSFDAFVRDHATSLLRTGFLLTGDISAAEDLLQETLAHLYPSWDRVISAQAPVAYVRRSLTNGYLNARRRRVVQLVDYDASAASQPVPDAADVVADRDETMRLLRLVNDRQRAALVMRYYHGLDDAEIAGVLDCREVSVRSLISRGLATMRSTRQAEVSTALPVPARKRLSS